MATPICPFCERPVIATVKESGGENFGTTIVSYYHDDGEVHFRVNKPVGAEYDITDNPHAGRAADPPARLPSLTITIPPEVIDAAVNAYAGAIWDADARPLDYQHAMRLAIAAALAAWPGAHMGHQCTGCGGDPQIILPLTQEASDDQ